MTTTWIYVIGAALGVLLLAILWKRIIRAILLLAGLGLAGVIAWAFAQQATATRQVAEAATVASRGSAAGNVALVLIVGLLVVGVIVIGLFALRRYLSQQEYVTWSNQPSLPQAYRPGITTDSTSINALVQLEMLRVLSEMRAPRAPAMLAVTDDDSDSGDDLYGEWWGNA